MVYLFHAYSQWQRIRISWNAYKQHKRYCLYLVITFSTHILCIQTCTETDSHYMRRIHFQATMQLDYKHFRRILDKQTQTANLHNNRQHEEEIASFDTLDLDF